MAIGQAEVDYGPVGIDCRQARGSFRLGKMNLHVRDTSILWVVVLGGGLALRLASTSGRGLWIDEAFTYEVVTSTPRGAFRLAMYDDFSPPLWNALCWLAVLPFRSAGVGVEGLSTVIRLIAVSMYAISVLALFVASKLGLLQGRAAILAASLLGITPVLVRTGSDARMYALCVPLVIFAVLAVMYAAQEGRSRDRWWIGIPLLLLSLSHYYGLFVAVGLLCWLAVRPTTGDSGVVERIRVRAVPLMTGGVAIASVAPLFVWHRARQFALRGTAHVSPARYSPSEWIPWLTVGLVTIWVAMFVAMLLDRPSKGINLGPAAAGALSLVLAISPTLLEADGRHVINPGFATVLGACLALVVGAIGQRLSRKGAALAGTAALIVSIVPVSGVMREVTSMGRPTALDMSEMAGPVLGDLEQRRDLVGVPVVWIYEWSWGDRYVQDVISAGTDLAPRFEVLHGDDPVLGGLTGSEKVTSTDVRAILQTKGVVSEAITGATLMYFVSRGGLQISDVDAGLSGCGFRTSFIAPNVIRSERITAGPCV